MNKLTKISATALLALLLTACDKPADKAADTTGAQTTQTAPAMNSEAQEKADYEKLIAWNKEQGAIQAKNQQKLQQALQEALATKDESKVKAAIDDFNQSVQESIASLDGLDIKSDLINSAKKQTKEVLTLASQVLVAQVNVKTEEDQKAYVEKATQLQEKIKALAELGAQLDAKFNPQPAQPSESQTTQPASK